MGQVQASLGVSERRACQVLGQHRSTQRKARHRPDDEAALTADVIELATTYGRYGYRRIAALLREAGWAVNVKRVARIWRQEGAESSAQATQAGPSMAQRRLVRAAARQLVEPCLELRLCRGPHPHDGRKFRMLCLIDEFTRLASPIWESALAAFGNEGAREIVYLVGYYCFISMILNGFAIPVPDVE